MKILIAFMMLVSSFMAMAEDAVMLEDGTVIYLPPFGQHCMYEEKYCPMGWLPDGTFPGVEKWYALLDECGYEPPVERPTIIHCQTGLQLSPNNCVNEDGEVVDLKTCPNDSFVIGPGDCPS